MPNYGPDFINRSGNHNFVQISSKSPRRQSELIFHKKFTVKGRATATRYLDVIGFGAPSMHGHGERPADTLQDSSFPSTRHERLGNASRHENDRSLRVVAPRAPRKKLQLQHGVITHQGNFISALEMGELMKHETSVEGGMVKDILEGAIMTDIKPVMHQIVSTLHDTERVGVRA